MLGLARALQQVADVGSVVRGSGIPGLRIERVLD